MTEETEPATNAALDLLIGVEQLGKPSRATLVYVAGPVSDLLRCNRKINIARAEFVGLAICHVGFTPVIPHKLFEGWEAYNYTNEEFYEMDLHILSRCQAICMVVGWQRSRGAKLEFAFAEENQIPVIYEAEVSIDVEDDTIEGSDSTEIEAEEGISLDSGVSDITSENRGNDT